MMKKTGIQPKLLLTAVTLLTLGLCASMHAETGSATVTSTEGVATFDNGSGAAPLAKGTTVGPGSVISTGEGGEVTLSLSNRAGTVIVGSGSVVVVDRLNYEKTGAGTVTDTQLDLREGCVLGEVNRFSSALSKFEIKVPTGVIGIDAGDETTSYHICTPDEIGIIAGYGVYVYTRDGVVRSVRIGGGNQFNQTTAGIAPIPPTVLDALITQLPTGSGQPTPTPTQLVTRPFNFFISPPGASASGGGDQPDVQGAEGGE
jgi:hypothetical protein